MIKILNQEVSTNQIAAAVDQYDIVAITGNLYSNDSLLEEVKELLSEMWMTRIIPLDEIKYPYIGLSCIYDANRFSRDEVNNKILRDNAKDLKPYIDEKWIIGGAYEYHHGIEKTKDSGRQYRLRNYDWKGNIEVEWIDTETIDHISYDSSILLGYLPPDNEQLNVRYLALDVYCYSCKEEMTAFAGVFVCTKNKDFADAFEFTVYPDLMEQLIKDETFIKSCKENKIGEIKHRYTKTRGYEYLSNGCITCDAVYGKHYQFKEMLEYTAADELPRTLFSKTFSYKQLSEMLDKRLILPHNRFKEREQCHANPIQDTLF